MAHFSKLKSCKVVWPTLQCKFYKWRAVTDAGLNDISTRWISDGQPSSRGPRSGSVRGWDFKTHLLCHGHCRARDPFTDSLETRSVGDTPKGDHRFPSPRTWRLRLATHHGTGCVRLSDFGSTSAKVGHANCKFLLAMIGRVFYNTANLFLLRWRLRCVLGLWRFYTYFIVFLL